MPLANRGTFSTVEVSVGTPAQKFDIVADTGSNAVIVLSCSCIDAGHCDDGDKCFIGTNRSSTFALGSFAQAGGEGVPSITMSFGSGDIQAVVASDVVRVGGAKSRMHDGVLLMVDKQLDFGGPFEGILGLGIPAASRSLLQSSHSEEHEHSAMRRLDTGEAFAPPEFLPSAGISRFSMCFNDGGASGVLRLGTPRVTLPLASVGRLHWGLGMSSVSVGDAKIRVDICNEADMREGQETPCGAIPDSGTTSIMAPESHLKTLFESICDAWPRCSEEAERSPMPKVNAFTQVLRDCDSWMSSSKGLSELPSIHFEVTGGESGQKQTLELGAWAYVLETVEEDYALAARHLVGVVPGQPQPKQAGMRVCSPAFGVMEMPTQLNGDVWILGTPFFYAFNVNYDLDSLSVAFEDEPCGACDSQAKLFSGGRTETRTDVSMRGPRPMRGPWRVPNIDVTQPM